MAIIGLTVANGQLRLNGGRFRGIGINWPGAVVRIFTQNPTGCNYTPSAEQDTAIAYFKSVGVRVIRIKAFPFYPNQWRDGVQATKAWNVATSTDRLTHYAYIDSFLAKCKVAGIGVILSMYFRWPTICDLVGEGTRQWLNSGSNTRAYAATITQEIVTRYTGGARSDLAEAVWGWEYGNEINHVNDCGSQPSTIGMWAPQTSYGTQSAGVYDTANTSVLLSSGSYQPSELAALLSWWDGVVAAIDPTRLRMSGNGPNSYWLTGGGGGVVQPITEWAAQIVRDNPHNTACIHWYGGVGYGSYNSRGLSSVIAAAKTAVAARGMPLIVGEYGNQPRTITNITVSAGSAAITVNSNWAAEVGDVLRVVGSGGYDADYTIAALASQTSPATCARPAGVPVGSSATGVVQHLVSQFQRQTSDILSGGADLAMVWCYESDPQIQAAQSLSHPANLFESQAVSGANLDIASGKYT